VPNSYLSETLKTALAKIGVDLDFDLSKTFCARHLLCRKRGTSLSLTDNASQFV